MQKLRTMFGLATSASATAPCVTKPYRVGSVASNPRGGRNFMDSTAWESSNNR